jgi:hypothetical protein
MFDDATDVMMSSGEPPLLLRLVLPQAGPVVMTAHPQIRVKI